MRELLFLICLSAALQQSTAVVDTQADNAAFENIDWNEVFAETGGRKTELIWDFDASLSNDTPVEAFPVGNLPDDTTDHPYIRGCYFTNWAQYRPGEGKFVPEDYQPGLCTHIFFAFGWMNEDFTVKAFDPVDVKHWNGGPGMYERVLNLRNTDPKLKVLLSIGGWTFGTRLFKLMSKDERSRRTFIDSAVNFVRKWNFDGLDLDWEYPVGDTDRRQFTVLMQELREEFETESTVSNRPRLLLTAAVSAGESTIKAAYDIPQIAKLLDFVLLMSYDFHGAWEDVTGPNSPLFGRPGETEKYRNWNMAWASKYWHESGMPRQKITVGIAAYGRGWTLKHPENGTGMGAMASGPAKSTKYVREAGVASYYEICEMLRKPGAKRHWHADHWTPYVTFDDQWFGYDDLESVGKKLSFIKENLFGGAFVWALDFDDFSGSFCGQGRYPLVSLIRDELTASMVDRPKIGQGKGNFGPNPEGVAGPSIEVEVSATMPPPIATRTAVPVATNNGPNPCSAESDGFFASKKAAEQEVFVLCLSGLAFEMRCPSRMTFNPLVGYCLYRTDDDLLRSEVMSTPPSPVFTVSHVMDVHEAKPRDDVTTWLPMELGTTESYTKTPNYGFTTHNPGKPVPYITCHRGNGFYRSPLNCNEFYRCVNGAKYRFVCPVGLVFNEPLATCVFPEGNDVACLWRH